MSYIFIRLILKYVLNKDKVARNSIWNYIFTEFISKNWKNKPRGPKRDALVKLCNGFKEYSLIYFI